MLSASHPYTYEITDGPDLLVKFENILLPDSTTNEPASNGFLSSGSSRWPSWSMVPPFRMRRISTLISTSRSWREVTLFVISGISYVWGDTVTWFDINPIRWMHTWHSTSLRQISCGSYVWDRWLPGKDSSLACQVYQSAHCRGAFGQGMYSVVLKGRGTVVGCEVFCEDVKTRSIMTMTGHLPTLGPDLKVQCCIG